MNIKRLLITAGAIFVFALLWFGFGLLEFCVYGVLATLLYPIKRNA